MELQVGSAFAVADYLKVFFSAFFHDFPIDVRFDFSDILLNQKVRLSTYSRTFVFDRLSIRYP